MSFEMNCLLFTLSNLLLFLFLCSSLFSSLSFPFFSLHVSLNACQDMELPSGFPLMPYRVGIEGVCRGRARACATQHAIYYNKSEFEISIFRFALTAQFALCVQCHFQFLTI